MSGQTRTGALDWVRPAAAVLVVAIHTGPLSSFSADADFLLTRVLARLAVPFFLLVTGYFSLSPMLEGRDPDRQGLGKLLKNAALMYLAAIVIYLPVSLYAGHYENLSALGFGRLLLFDGAYYHLWYFPALMLGAVIVCALSRILRPGAVLAVCALLYLIGLGGDSYFGLTAKLSPMESAYAGMFQIFSYTRNGLFFTPLFLALGARLPQLREKRTCAADFAAFLACFAGMTAEALALRALGWPRHDSMYLLLPAASYFLLRMLLRLPARPVPKLRRFSAWLYVLHPLAVVAVRGAARVLSARAWLLDNSLLYFLCVLASSSAAAWGFAKLEAWLRKKPDLRGRAWVEIDADALRGNVCALRARLPERCTLMPALKADAYGHGAVQCARILRTCGIDSFCVACVSEGIRLRRHGIGGEILILGYTHPSDFPLLRRWRLTQTVLDREYAQMLQSYGRRLRVHIALDTGMHRLGQRVGDTNAVLEIFNIKNLQVTGIYSHLCTDASTPQGLAYSQSQQQAFCSALEWLAQHGVHVPKAHLLASTGILGHPQFYGDAVRPGIALYGACAGAQDAGLMPVLTWKARVTAVKTLSPGESAGYDLHFTAERETRIAVLCVGYADGLPRALSNGQGRVLLCGKAAPILGWICMDQTIVDISSIPGTSVGMEAVLIGKSGELENQAVELASAGYTIPNELLSRIGARCPRIYS